VRQEKSRRLFDISDPSGMRHGKKPIGFFDLSNPVSDEIHEETLRVLRHVESHQGFFGLGWVEDFLRKSSPPRPSKNSGEFFSSS
jgi:hypothetical protein